MGRRTWIGAGVLLLVAIFFAATWYVGFVNRSHPAPWPMAGRDAARSYQTKAQLPASPKLLWSYQLEDSFVTQPVIWTDGTVYVGNGTKLIAVGPDGKRRWAWNSKTTLSSLALGRRGTIYAANAGGVYALDPTGAKVWEFEYSLNQPIFNLLIGQGGVIYATGQDYLYAISQDGKLKWRFKGNRITSDPVETEKGHLLFTIGDTLYEIDAYGDEVWSRQVSSGQRHVVTVAPDGMIFVRGLSYVSVVDAEGNLLNEISNTAQPASSPAQPNQGAGRALTVPESFARMSRFLPRTGTQYSANLSVGEGYVQNGLTRLDGNGRPVWSASSQWGPGTTYSITDQKGAVLMQQQVLNTPLAILWMADKDGNELWSFDQAFPQGSSAVTADGRICFAGRVSGKNELFLTCIGDQ